MSKESGSRLSVVTVSPYPLVENSPDGVTNFILESRSYLEAEGCLLFDEFSTRTVGSSLGPGIKNEADYKLGLPLGIPLGDTNARVMMTINKWRAKNIYLTTKPDIVVLHEPPAGTGAHTLISAAPKRAKDGKPLSAFIGHFHAQAENLGLMQQFLYTGTKLIRRPKFSRYGFPKGITSGYLNTIKNGLDGRIAVSQATANFCQSFYGDNREYVVIPNGIDVNNLTPEGPRREDWNDGKKTILFAGRHDKRKGVEYLILAYDLLKKSGKNDIKLKITGDGQETRNLKQLRDYLDISDVEFLDVLPREELIKAYRSADLFVSPAIGGEGFGRTLAEALACGTLVVGSDINGYREVIGPEATGGGRFIRMAEPQNQQDLAEKMWELLSLPEEERQRLEEQASLYVRGKFAWPVVAKQLVRLYDDVLTKHGQPKNEDWPAKRRGIIFKRAA